MTDTLLTVAEKEEEAQENMKTVLALKSVFGVETRDELFDVASTLKANLDAGILVYKNRKQ